MTSVVVSGIIIGRIWASARAGLNAKAEIAIANRPILVIAFFTGVTSVALCSIIESASINDQARHFRSRYLKPCNGRPSGLIANSERRLAELNHHVAIGQTSHRLRRSIGAARRTRVVDGARAGGAGCAAKADGRADPRRNAQ